MKAISYQENHDNVKELNELLEQASVRKLTSEEKDRHDELITEIRDFEDEILNFD